MMKTIVNGLCLAAASFLVLGLSGAAKPRIVFIGDSVTSSRMGYCFRVFKNPGPLADKADLVVATTNATGGGDNDTTNASASDNTRRHIRYWLKGPLPDIVHINTGLWEIKGILSPVGKGVLDKYKLNLDAIFDSIHAVNPKAQIVWCMTTPVTDNGKRIDTNVVLLNKAALEVTTRRKIAVSDLYRFCKANQVLPSPDGVHYDTAAASRQWGFVSQQLLGMVGGSPSGVTGGLWAEGLPGRAAGPRFEAGRGGLRFRRGPEAGGMSGQTKRYDAAGKEYGQGG